MPRLSSLGSAVQGYAGAICSIDGSTPAAFAGRASGHQMWWTDTDLFGQVETSPGSGVFQIQTYSVGGGTFTLVQNFGSFWEVAGGGNYAWWNTSHGGAVTNVPGVGPSPLGYPLAVDFDGSIAMLTLYSAGSGITIYSATGVQRDSQNVTIGFNGLSGTCPVFLRGGILSYLLSGQGYRLRDTTTQLNLAFLVRDDAPNWVTPVTVGADIWVLEGTDGLMIRKATDTTPWVVQPTGGANTFNPDVILLSPGVVRIAWSTSAGENPADLVVMDLTLATGANTVGVVVAGVLVFTPQAALSTTTVTGTISPGGSGGGGGGAGGPGSPGRGVIAANTPHTAPKLPPRPAPHVVEVKDFPTKQSLTLAWDRLGDHREQIAAQAERLNTQDATIAELRAMITALQTKVGG